MDNLDIHMTGEDEVANVIEQAFDRCFRMRNLVPAGPEMPGAYTVPTPRVSYTPHGVMKMDTSSCHAVVELACEFEVTDAQQHHRSVFLTLAAAASSKLARAVDLVIVFGGGREVEDALKNMHVIGHGLEHHKGLDALRACPLAEPGSNVSEAVAHATANLQTGVFCRNKAQSNDTEEDEAKRKNKHKQSLLEPAYGPFAAALCPSAWRMANQSSNAIQELHAILGSNRIAPIIVPEKLKLPGNTGVVFEYNAECFDFVMVSPPQIPTPPEVRGGTLLHRVSTSFLFRTLQSSAGRVLQVGGAA